jgi:hypothetical protein
MSLDGYVADISMFRAVVKCDIGGGDCKEHAKFSVLIDSEKRETLRLCHYHARQIGVDLRLRSARHRREPGTDVQVLRDLCKKILDDRDSPSSAAALARHCLIMLDDRGA